MAITGISLETASRTAVSSRSLSTMKSRSAESSCCVDRQAGLKTIDLTLDKETFFFGQAIDFTGLEHFLKTGQLDDTLLNGDQLVRVPPASAG